MDLLTYAVSQKLRKGVDMWELVHQGKDVPVSIIESAFAETLDTFKDDVAERLVKDYNSYISYDVPVTMAPEIGGMTVRGHLDDTVTPIVQAIHGKSKEAVVTDVITRAVHTINPSRQINVTDIEFSDSVKQFAENVALNHAILEQFGQPKPEPEVDLDEPVRIEPVKKELDLASAYATLEDAGAKYHQYDTHTITSETPTVDIPTPTLMDLETNPHSETVVDKSVESTPSIESEVTEVGVLKSVWNSFIDDLKSRDMENRIEFTTPLTYAL